ncbi:MAG: short-chain dehydrogenase/reductase [Paenibacillaceae bacterium]|jgi:benzil reductase ((S)-benzoin forming)|nr:short-chain dehydrogenase/reductase [Paenibacillaceae bacterium]
MDDYYIITGASRGLGAALSKQLLAQKSYVYGLSRSRNEQIEEFAKIHGGNYIFRPMDLADLGGVSGTLTDILTDISTRMVNSLTLINNAATVTPINNLEHCEAEEMIANIHTNLLSPMILSSTFIKHSSWCEKRCIVNITSGSAVYPASGMSTYCASKSGMNMFTRCVGLEQANNQNPVTMIAIDPGMMDTSMQGVAREADFELSGYFRNQKEQGRLSDPEEVAKKVISLIDRTPSGEVVSV